MVYLHRLHGFLLVFLPPHLPAPCSLSSLFVCLFVCLFVLYVECRAVDVLGCSGVRVTVDFNLLLLVNCFGRL